VRADQLKQALKNGVYRALGETATGVGAVNGAPERSLVVLMYHKVNDVLGNSVTVPVSLFDEQLTQLAELGYTPVSLEDVLAYYRDRVALPERAVLITFDDGYLDNLENAVPVLRRHGYPAVLFVPIGYLDESRPLPHDEHLAANGILNRTLDWEQLRDLEAAGVRIESHGIGHRPLADLELDEATREVTLSKLRLEERLGRPIQAFAYVKGSEAHYRPVHLSLLRQAGYELAFTSISGGNGAHTDPLQLHRYNVEPYPTRTFELVLSGACDLIALKDTVAGTHARRLFNAALGTSTK
jgi:peptidoglycan/xylan/chitin deacetylase (PgdA/CDA1 family)